MDFHRLKSMNEICNSNIYWVIMWDFSNKVWNNCSLESSKYYNDTNQHIGGISQHFGDASQCFGCISQHFDEANQRFDEANQRFESIIQLIEVIKRPFFDCYAESS